MNFLAIDTAAKYLSVVAYADGRAEKRFRADCALRHSVLLMDEIEAALGGAGMTPKDCDFFVAVVGPGSFTGIRIGISTVKGLCYACGKPALGVTSFDCLAYAERSVPLLTLADAGHGFFYACAYDREKRIARPPAYLSREETEKIAAEGFLPVAAEKLFEGCLVADPCEGLLRAALAKRDGRGETLSALYLRKSSAEEMRR